MTRSFTTAPLRQDLPARRSPLPLSAVRERLSARHSAGRRAVGAVRLRRHPKALPESKARTGTCSPRSRRSTSRPIRSATRRSSLRCARQGTRLRECLAQERRPESQRLAEGPRLVPGRGRGQPAQGDHHRHRLDRQRRQRPGRRLRRRRQAGDHLRSRKRAQGQARADGALRRPRHSGARHL